MKCATQSMIQSRVWFILIWVAYSHIENCLQYKLFLINERLKWMSKRLHSQSLSCYFVHLPLNNYQRIQWNSIWIALATYFKLISHSVNHSFCMHDNLLLQYQTYKETSVWWCFNDFIAVLSTLYTVKPLHGKLFAIPVSDELFIWFSFYSTRGSFSFAFTVNRCTFWTMRLSS